MQLLESTKSKFSTSLMDMASSLSSHAAVREQEAMLIGALFFFLSFFFSYLFCVCSSHNSLHVLLSVIFCIGHNPFESFA